jgi:Flp pilus assembly protein TadG
MREMNTMKQHRNSACKGQALVEFTLVGIPMMFVAMSVVAVSIDMWQYQNLAYATTMTARYASMHGATCSQNGNTCTITIGNMATFFASQAMALNAGSVNVTITDGGGSTTCNPVNSCNSGIAQFPSTGNNSVGSDVTVSATYTLKNPIAMFWPPDSDAAHDFVTGAKSRQRIMF